MDTDNIKMTINKHNEFYITQNAIKNWLNQFNE